MLLFIYSLSFAEDESWRVFSASYDWNCGSVNELTQQLRVEVHMDKQYLRK